MSGILNTKQRILDTIVTTLGRQQMATGMFRVRYVTFTDGATFYQADVTSGSADATQRLFFECSQLPQDQITFTTDDAGKLAPLSNGSGYEITAGKIFSGSSVDLTFITGSDFASTSDTLLASSINNFQKLYALATIDPVFDDTEFLLSDTSVSFKITDQSPINDPNNQAVNVTHLDSFFGDRKLSHLINFKFLPPLNRVLDTSADLSDNLIQQQYHLGTYVPFGSSEELDYDTDIKPEIEKAAKTGNVKVITFDPTTNQNTLAAQLFEMRSDELLKLDVFEYGKFKTDDPAHPDRHVFFAGKVFLDDNQTHTFARIFTIIFE